MIKFHDDAAAEKTRVQVFAGGVGALGFGAYLPEKILTNGDLEKIVETTDEWIIQRTGISERRLAAEDETTAALAVNAAKTALADAGVDGGQIGLVIVATATPDYFAPATASIVQRAIGAENCAAFDLNAGCTGSVYGLVMANSYIRSGACGYALVIGAETLSRAVDWGDRKTCILFGDGAGAAVLGRTPEGSGIVSSMLLSDGEEADAITIPAYSVTKEDLERRGGIKKQTIWLDGSKVMKFASRAMSSAVADVAAGAGLDVGDIDLVVPHQANIRIIENAAKRLGLREDKVYVNVGRYGNTSAASVLIALYEAHGEGRLKNGEYAALVAFGAGLTYGAVLMKWPDGGTAR
jgi:3-oxoacyl-[acyl-carrier-protein] synthase-3